MRIPAIPIILYFCFLPGALTRGQTWNNDFGDSLYIPDNPDSYVSCLLHDENNLIVAGPILKAGELWINGITVWNGTNWANLGAGLTHFAGGINCMVKYNDKLVIGGGFLEAGNTPGTRRLAVWDGSNWSGIGEPSSVVEDFTILHDTLIVSGGFSSIDGTALVGIAAYYNNEWINIGTPDWGVPEVCVYNDELYIGGNFTSINSQYLPHIARREGQSWTSVGGGLNGVVEGMVVDTVENVLYVGGGFTRAYNDSDTVIVRNLAMWDGENWHDVGGGVECCPYSKGLALYRGDLYVGGSLEDAGGMPVNYIARWDGGQWDSLGCGTDNTINALAVYNDELYVGGFFNYAGGKRAYGIARWFMPPDTGCAWL
ncbi:MAG: hypothetical protein KJ607_01215, partial [Bacteroidetes bacterium]|nr:hypothetical protein [Bacteroidota bacterium]